MHHPQLESAPGTVSQVRDSDDAFHAHAKSRGVPVFLVGHMTKDGVIAGPRVVEHMVDAVLQFEGNVTTPTEFSGQRRTVSAPPMR